MKEHPSENRIFTGSDDEFTTEQTANLLKSKKFDQVQKKRIGDIVSSSVDPNVEAAQRDKQVLMAIQLIRHTRHGDLLAGILECRYAGYSYKQIAKTLMETKGDSVPIFLSLSKAIKFVQDSEKEGMLRVQTQLGKRRIVTP